MTVDSVERAVGEIADGATSQAQDAQNASESVYSMGEMIEETAKEVENLNATADYMRQSSTQASQSLMELRSINDEVKEAIDLIYDQTNRTNESSMNASIEAARAGEQGRSFAVVANQIQKLADQSNASTDAIDDIINELINDSNEAVKTMEKVREIINNQSENVVNTETIVEQVMNGIEESIRGIEAIENRTVALNEARSAIVDVVQGLSAVAEENAASTEETSAATEEVANSFNEVTESAEVVKNAADRIADSMSNFQI